MDTITIELRSRLRSCNIFISSEKKKNNIEKNTINLKLNDSEIRLKIGNKTFHFPLTSAKIIPKTLSSLNVNDNWISLRVQTQPTESSYGSFTREIVSAEDSHSAKLSSPIELCLKEKDLVIRCTRCKNQITGVIFFKRVLPLPSGNTDPGEWFCCTHGGNYKALTEPGETDCFYERDYRILNKGVFNKELKIEDKNKGNEMIRCNRCFSGIGVRNLESVNEASVKVWNCCVDYKFLDLSSGVDLNSSDPLKDFSTIILDRTDIFTGNKIILQTCEGSRYHFLIVRVMDKNLELLVEKDYFRNEDLDCIVELDSIKVTKVLYKYSETEDGIKNESVDVDRCQIALPVMLAAVDHLSSTTKRYPPACRVVDEYFVGYINSCGNKNA